LPIRVIAFSHLLYPTTGSFCGMIFMRLPPVPELGNKSIFGNTLLSSP